MLSVSTFFAVMWIPLVGMWALALVLSVIALRCATPPRDRWLQLAKIAAAALMFGYFFTRVATGVPHTAEGGEQWLWIRNLASMSLAVVAVWESLARVRRSVDLRRGLTRRARLRREVGYE